MPLRGFSSPKRRSSQAAKQRRHKAWGFSPVEKQWKPTVSREAPQADAVGHVRAAEFFAGIGLDRLALERQG